MSDYFTMLVDCDVSLEDAEVTLRNVVAELQRLKIIVDDLTDDCVLSGFGYRPGTAIDDVYKTSVTESPFWQLRTCGVEPMVKRHFNYWAYGPSFDGISCPNCKTYFQNLPDYFSTASLNGWISLVLRLLNALNATVALQ